MSYAAVVYKTSDPMKIEEVTYRSPGEHEVLVKMAACGVCHSDLSVLNNVLPSVTPVILGHEAAGVVEEVGAKVTGVAKGDHVVGVWRPGCGKCRYCREDKHHLCKHGEDPTSRAGDRVKAGDKKIFEFLGVGGFSEYTILADDALVKVDKSLPLDKMALLGCAVITGFGAAERAVQIKEGDEVAVFGCGGVGLNVIQGAKHCGASVVIAVDVDERKLETARDFGATHTVDAKDEKATKAIRQMTTEGMGVDFAFDAVGSTQVIDMAWKSTCRGGEIILVGIPKMTDTFPYSPTMNILFEKGIRGCLAGSASPYTMIPHFVKLYREKKLKLDELVTKTYSLKDANGAMDDLRQGKNARGVLLF